MQTINSDAGYYLAARKQMSSGLLKIIFPQNHLLTNYIYIYMYVYKEDLIVNNVNQ